MDFEEILSGSELYWCGSGEGQVTVSCEHGDEPSVFIQCEEIPWLAEEMIASQEGPAAWNYCLKVNGSKINSLDGDKWRDSESKFTAHIFWVIYFEL
jgi:hypothetical protein